MALLCWEYKCIPIGESNAFRYTDKTYMGYLSGKAVCTGSAVFVEGSASIHNFATLPEYRNQGLGTAMFHHILSEIKKITADSVFLRYLKTGWESIKKQDLNLHAVYICMRAEI
jgi:ribosomal protein S18 acetylase RimI-like enzyme